MSAECPATDLSPTGLVPQSLFRQHTRLARGATHGNRPPGAPLDRDISTRHERRSDHVRVLPLRSVADPSRDADPARPDHSPGTGTIAGGFGDESRRPQVACDQLAQLRAQVEANDLTPAQARSLQARVDRVVARTDGTQVAINQVVWDGGDTLIPLPGEERARTRRRGEGDRERLLPPTHHEDPAGVLQGHRSRVDRPRDPLHPSLLTLRPPASSHAEYGVPRGGDRPMCPGRSPDPGLGVGGRR